MVDSGPGVLFDVLLIMVLPVTLNARAIPDTLFGGTMTLHQPARGEGYRVNVDAVLLAWFAGRARRARRAVDLGAGVGAVGLCLLYRDRVDHVLLIDKDRGLAALSQKNLTANGWDDRGQALALDILDLSSLAPASADLIVCNPPYVAPGRGRLPGVTATARVGPLGGFTRAARRLLGPRGRAAFVYPAGELATLFEELRAAGLEPKRMRLVHATRDQPARIALVEAVPGKRGGLVVSPPVFERDGQGPSAELTAMLAAAAHGLHSGFERSL
jgi:tRNA1Val (adenine37-N6)-methyltransferase